MATPTYEYSGVCYTATAGQTTFALTTSGGNSIGYLKPEHIKVRTSADNGDTWVGLSLDIDYVFADPATSIVLNTGATADTLVDISRTTPMDEDWIVFQSGNLLTAGQLNEFETWQLYIDQELADSIGNGSGGGGGGPETTDQLPEGVTNLYYTDSRVESYVSGAGYIKDAGVTKLVAGTNIVLSPSNGEGIVTIQSIGGSAINYMGLVNATEPAPAGPRNGDMYVNTEAGNADASWTGISGEALVGNERLIYDATTTSWGIIRDIGIPEAPSNGQLYARKDQDWEPFTIPADPKQSDWSETDTASLAFIKNKPTIPGAQNLQSVCTEGNTTTLTIQAAGFRVDQLTTLPTD
ncbi:hypothetical protein HOQ57_gp27 [uncultured phage_MedDCM-OCT-S39-C11]|uniref:Bacteriophage T7 tail fibre protein-like N-terminal domain-containing protein n=1 Tax=uncultured phage_MedDCM-OCT-S39-C11 TaxID=2740805 RepID=A0A6S4PD66_9CAUD|nr:hypothetical protein HOQ57_gp27 [uncultured phage_MedDCM-OCT-S39-C11]BAQ94497.1 hypothetical protein [uncultured phage_MedDCM-OCT-S39-C11]